MYSGRFLHIHARADRISRFVTCKTTSTALSALTLASDSQTALCLASLRFVDAPYQSP